MIDKEMVRWINATENRFATAADFWKELYQQYKTPEMIERFGDGVLDYIERMLKK